MKVLIEIKNGIVTACYSNNKDVQVQILDHDNKKDVPEFDEHEAECLGIKGLKQKVSEIMESAYPELDSIEDFND